MIPRLCFITDAGMRLPIPDQAERAARGGAGWVQLRHKTLDDVAFADLARAVRARLAPLNVSLIVNDRIDVARAIDAAGLHIGQSDGDPAVVRSRIGPDMILGLSIETQTQLPDVPPTGVDYLGVGPIRATGSKIDHATPIGFDGLSCISARTSLPCMAIGGLTAADVSSVRAAGCLGIAVVSAISRAEEPEAAAREFIDHWSMP